MSEASFAKTPDQAPGAADGAPTPVMPAAEVAQPSPPIEAAPSIHTGLVETGPAQLEPGQLEPDQLEPDHPGGWAWDGLPGIPASAGALVWDAEGRFLILAPTYKSGWTIPGGVMEVDETPWEAAQREVAEETGITVTRGRLVAVDTRPAKRAKALGLRFLFDCGVVSAESVKGVAVQAEEVREYRFASPAEALELLRPAVSRRVAAALKSQHCIYLQDGNPVAGVMA
ncbi:MAG: NUDIX hydrolase [Dermatophilaceae bacterium]